MPKLLADAFGHAVASNTSIEDIMAALQSLDETTGLAAKAPPPGVPTRLPSQVKATGVDLDQAGPGGIPYAPDKIFGQSFEDATTAKPSWDAPDSAARNAPKPSKNKSPYSIPPKPVDETPKDDSVASEYTDILAPIRPDTSRPVYQGPRLLEDIGDDGEAITPTSHYKVPEPKPEPPKHSIKPLEPQDLAPIPELKPVPKDDSGYNGDYLGELRRSDDPLHPYEEPGHPSETNPVTDHESALQKEMDDYEKWLKGGGTSQQDWGPLLGLIDSWTGSHILPGYQHPKQPLSDDERRKMVLQLKQKAVEMDDKRVYNKANLERMKSATESNYAYRMAALGPNQDKVAMRRELVDDLKKRIDSDPKLKDRLGIDANGRPFLLDNPRGTATGGRASAATHRNVKTNALGQLIDADTGDVIDANTRPARAGRTPGAKGPPPIKSKDLSDVVNSAMGDIAGVTYNPKDPKTANFKGIHDHYTAVISDAINQARANGGDSSAEYQAVLAAKAQLKQEADAATAKRAAKKAADEKAAKDAAAAEAAKPGFWQGAADKLGHVFSN